MALFKYPEDTPEARQKWLRSMDLNAQANDKSIYGSKGGRFDEFFYGKERDWNRSWFQKGLGRALGQTANYYGQENRPAAQDAAANKRIADLLKEEQTGTVFKRMQKYYDEGLLTDEGAKSFNSLIQAASEYVPNAAQLVTPIKNAQNQYPGMDTQFNKQAAIDAVTGSSFATPQTPSPQAQTATQTTPATQTAPQGATTPQAAADAATVKSATSQGDIAAAQKVLEGYLKSGAIDQATYLTLKTIMEGWNPETEISISNILTSFDELSKNTIDPYFQEQAMIAKDSIASELGFAQGERGRQLTAEQITAEENIRGAKSNLESRGMTFTGEAGRMLGAQSAIGGQQFGEGLIPQQNQLTASSSAARYQKSLQDLQRQAELTLGTTGAAGLVPGASQLGGVTGTMPQQQQQAKGSALTSLYNQEQQNLQAKTPIQVFK